MVEVVIDYPLPDAIAVYIITAMVPHLTYQF